MQKIAIITGADSGLGREYTQRIAEDPNIDEVWALAKTRLGCNGWYRILASGSFRFKSI